MKRVAISLAVATVLGTVSAQAQDSNWSDAPPPKKISDPFMSVELRFGPYRPQVDRAFSNAAPYSKVFGNSTRFMLSGEVDWQAVHIPSFGSVGVGGLIGYTSASANAGFSDGSGPSAEDTGFSLWLLSALAVVRVDVLARHTWIPLVPYGKVGPAVGLWSASNGSGTSEVNGVKGRGRTGGMLYAVGMMFLLDAIDRQSAKTFAAERGVKHTYFFGELTLAEVNGLGQSNAMQVGDRTWTLGLSMEL
jgi:hypothetical protein